tara:strand:+ start:358 stop:705 length:348 start_codon:yes stop_codon:yes gene_type:complete
LGLGKAISFALFLFSVQNYSTVTDLNKTENYRSFQNLELKPFALISFSNVDNVPFIFHNKINNVSIPKGSEFKRLSPSSNKLLLTFEDITNPKRIKIVIHLIYATIFKPLPLNSC